MIKLKHILFPTDFSETTLAAANQAVTIAKEFHAELTFVHVISYRTMVGVYDLPISYYADLEHEIRRSAEGSLTRLIQTCEIPSTTKMNHQVIEGDAADKICELAKSLTCDLIVIPTHGRKGVSRWFLGSVAERVVRLAPCPVLTVHADASETDKKSGQ